jgi:hypothetical protein
VVRRLPSSEMYEMWTAKLPADAKATRYSKYDVLRSDSGLIWSTLGFGVFGSLDSSSVDAEAVSDKGS